MLESIWNLATVMMRGYAQAHPAEDFQIVALEKGFQGPIVNPATGAESRSFLLVGKVDGILLLNRQRYRWSTRPQGLAPCEQRDRRLIPRTPWTDFQITLYAGYLEKVLDKRIQTDDPSTIPSESIDILPF